MNILMFGFGEDWPVWERTGFRARVPNLLKAFGQEEKVDKILFVNNPASVSRGYKNILLNRRWGTKSGKFIDLSKNSYLTKVSEKIYTLDWMGSHLFPGKDLWMEMTEGRNGTRVLKLLKKSLDALNMDNILVWTANPFVENLSGLLNEKFLVFDAIDNWLEHPYLKRYSKKINRAYEQVAKKADLISTVSNPLKDYFKSLSAKEVLCLPNAVDYKLYSRMGSDSDDMPDDIKDISRPVLGMVGILSGDVDFELLKYLGSVNKDWNIVLVGSEIEGTDMEAIRGLKNVHILGYREPEKIPDYLAGFDVCMSLYKTNASSDSKDPMKLYEYLASGKPVVSTDVKEARKLNKVIKIAKSKEEFADHVKELLSMDSEQDKEKRLAAAKENNWGARVKTVLDVVEIKEKSLFDLSVIIVNWNTRDLLKECLGSIYEKIKNVTCEIIVIDNLSSDGSAAMIKSDFPQVRLIENKENVGFGRANNQGFKISRGKHLLFLNPDTVVTADAVPDLIKFSESHPSVGIIGPKIFNPDGTIQISCQGFPRIYWLILSNLGLARFLPKKLRTRYNCYFWDFNCSRYVDSVGGACIFMKSNVFKSIGGFDEDLFMYGEDLELGYRALEHGWRSYFLNVPFIMHHENQSGIQKWDSLSRLKENYKSLYLFYRKHHGRIALFLFRLIMGTGSLFRFGIYKLAYLLNKSNGYKSKIQLNKDVFLINLKD